MPVKRKKAEKPHIDDAIIKGMIDKKAKNIVSIDFSKFQNTMFSRFIICMVRRVHS